MDCRAVISSSIIKKKIKKMLPFLYPLLFIIIITNRWYAINFVTLFQPACQSQIHMVAESSTLDVLCTGILWLAPDFFCTCAHTMAVNGLLDGLRDVGTSAGNLSLLVWCCQIVLIALVLHQCLNSPAVLHPKECSFRQQSIYTQDDCLLRSSGALGGSHQDCIYSK